MCTSFVLYADKTYIGMNFDISDRPIKLCMRGADQLVVYQHDGSRFYPSFGINRSGTFTNMLMVDPIEAGVYRRGKNCIHINRVFDDILAGDVAPDALSDFLRDKAVVNVPGFSVHSMVAARNRCAYVIEPGRGTLPFDSGRSDFLALSNFPLSDFADQDYRVVTGPGADRYRTCCAMLSERGHPFSVDQGFKVLAATSQADGHFPTQLSMLAIPEAGIVYFALARDYSRRYAFSFEDTTIRIDAGFHDKNVRRLDGRGITLAELAAF